MASAASWTAACIRATPLTLCRHDTDLSRAVRILDIQQFDGLGKIKVNEAMAGDIVAVSGIEGVNIGDTLCQLGTVDPLPFAKITDPTLSVVFSVNDSPFAGD